MAAFADDRSQCDSPQHPPPSTYIRRHRSDTSRTQSKHAQLPEGACNYRDLNSGPKPPGCGCRRFWLGPGIARIGQLGLLQAQEPWCACGHHACFHDRKEGSKRRSDSTEPSLDSKESLSQSRDAEVHQGNTAPTLPWPNRPASPSQRFPIGSRQQQIVPGPSNSGLPPIPSFHLTSSELRGYTNYNGSVGLGLDLQRSVHTARLPSQSPTVPDAVSITDDLPPTEPLPSTRQASTEDHVSPDGAFMRYILEGRRQVPQLDVNSAFKAPVGTTFGDLIQSATEIATPSISTTPNLTGAGQLIQEAADIVEALQQSTTVVTPHGDIGLGRPSSASNDAETQADRHTGSDATTLRLPQSLHDVLQGVPSALQRLAPLLSSLRSQLARDPDVSIHESISSLAKRMDTLENASFHQLPPEQVHEQFQHMDMRLLELETRTDEHSRLISAFDPGSSDQGSQTRSKKVLNENASFTSNLSGHSLDSATSSALIAAAIDRVEAEERLKAVEDRLDTLEALQMPSASLPWEVEVVLLPWGQDLQGLWHDFKDIGKPDTIQDDEDWTQARTAKSTSRASISLGESGWSEHAIQKWADDEDARLWPKACGVNSIVYHRLKSRGLVRKVTLTSSGARDVISTISRGFGELLDNILHTCAHDRTDEDRDADDQMGLAAPFIPLRKVHKSSRLRFLTDTELVTPAVWNAEFLGAGVLMRAPGGQKRLFITTRAGYVQKEANGWTWSRLRQLPRIHDPDSQRPKNEDVPEADAREPCWKHHPAIDGAPSAQSSFHSPFIEELERADREYATNRSRHVSDGGTRVTIEKEVASPRMHQPITPTSEFPTTQTSSHYQRKLRRLSSLSDAALPSKAKTDSLPQLIRPISQQAKRRIRSFEQATNPSLIAVLPTFVPSPTRGTIRSMRIKKRRRMNRSESVSSAGSATQSTGRADIQSLNPEADPEQVLRHLQDVIPHGGEIKPLSHFEPRSRDGVKQHSPSFEMDAASHGTSRNVGVRATEKRGVTPSAYATPYSGTIAGAGELDDEYLPSDSAEEEDWAGVDEDQAASNSDDDMDDDDSELVEGSYVGNDEEGTSDELHEDEDDEMISSEDELQLG